MSDTVNIEDARLAALRHYLATAESVAAGELDEIAADDYDPTSFDANGGTYRILTDEEADEAVIEVTRESIWAFNTSFLAGFMPDGIDAGEIRAIRGDRCEDANAAILALIKAGGYTVEEVAAEYASTDGRGHALAEYDHEEAELHHDGRTWFIYRTN